MMLFIFEGIHLEIENNKFSLNGDHEAIKICSLSNITNLIFMGILKMHEQGNLSEWLRRKIRNLLGFARAGSSPAVVVILQIFLEYNLA